MSDILKEHPGYWYLATPYSKWKDGIEDAFRQAVLLAGKLIRSGVAIYSPIAHTHPIATLSGLDPLDHGIWMPADKPLVDAAYGLLVADLEGWRDSFGVRQEILWFAVAGKPSWLLDPETLAARQVPRAGSERVTVTLSDPDKRHYWGPSMQWAHKSERECKRCGVVKITRQVGEYWRGGEERIEGREIPVCERVRA